MDTQDIHHGILPWFSPELGAINIQVQFKKRIRGGSDRSLLIHHEEAYFVDLSGAPGVFVFLLEVDPVFPVHFPTPRAAAAIMAFLDLTLSLARMKTIPSITRG